MKYKFAVEVYESGFWYIKFRYETEQEAKRFASICRRDGVKCRVIKLQATK